MALLQWNHRFKLHTFLLLSLITINVIQPSKGSLYSPNDPGIIELDGNNFKSIVFKQTNAFFIEFYNSWCPHCIRFAPIWKSLAADVQSWSPVVKLATIDCAEDLNVPTCREYAINSYPTLRFFKFNSSAENHGEQYTGPIQSAETIRHGLIDFLTSSWSSGVPREWPDLMSFSAPNKIEFFKRLPLNKNLPVLIVLEDEKSYVGREVILDFSRYQFSLIIFRALNLNEKLLTEILPRPLSDYTLPLLMEAKTDHSVEVLLTSARVPTAEEVRNQTSTYIKEQYLKELHQFAPVASKSAASPSPNDHKVASVHHSRLPKEMPVYVSDLYKSLRYTIFQQLGLRKELNASECNIIKRLVDVIDKYFPFVDQSSHDFIKYIKRWLDHRKTLKVTELLNYMNDVEKLKPVPQVDHWVRCKGSQPKYRGYTCSVWTMFHTLTVVEYLERKDEKWSTLHQVLYTMRDYIPRFFSCSHCARHFASMAENIESELVFANSSVLWLWRAHNKVNKRLSGDLTEDPEYPKHQYPSSVECPSCYFSNGSFNEQKVLSFLIKTYRRESIINDLKESTDSSKLTQETQKELEEVIDETPSKNTFTFMDMSLFLLLYLISALILVGLFFSVKIKRRKKLWRLKEKYFNNFL